MKNIVFYLVVVYAFICMNLSCLAQTPYEDPTWVLTWSDEFNGTSIDASKWGGQWPWNQQSYGRCLGDTTIVYTNEDYLAFTKRNFENNSCSGGIMTSSVKKEEITGDVWDRWELVGGNWIPVDSTVSWHYSKAMLFSKRNFRFGYIDFKFKFPVFTPPASGKGIGACLWMWETLPYDDTIAQSEIDIFEARGLNNSGGPNVHFAQTTGAPQYDLFYWGGIPGPCLTPDFSDYRRVSAEWSSGYIKFFLDDSLVATNIEHSGDLRNMPFILDMGHPTLNYCDSVDIVNTQYPWEWKVDYIRISLVSD
jgi:hypothetical protein